jgi:hypothetical protein
LSPYRLLRPATLLALAVALSAAPARALTTPALLDTLQHSAFNYFWIEANPANGLVKDRSTPGSVSSIACTGFGLSAIAIGIDHGWVTRTDGRNRVLTTLATFRNGPQGSAASGKIGYLGLFYHWLDMTTATRTWDSELSTIDTALLMAGIIDVREYFDTADPQDSLVRAYADSIVRRCNWDIMRNFGTGIYMGWKPAPGGGFNSFGRWQGYNEAMILYLLALGSPTFPVPTNNWAYWTGTYDYATYYGQTFIVFPPLFGHQYSHCWVDFRYKADAYTSARNFDYFANSRRATLAQQAYCIDNPGGWTGYSNVLWGLTASDVPTGYSARGAPPAQNDDGTITPTAAASSIAFAPEIVIPTLHNLYDNYPLLWGPYGFKDAFNPTLNWYDTDVLGIDQGPILIMIENYRTGRVWQRFMRNSWIQTGLARAGFLTTTAVGEPFRAASALELAPPSPNPSQAGFTLRFRLPAAGHVRLTLVDLAGREVSEVLDGPNTAGDHTVAAPARALSPGIYFARLEWNGRVVARRVAVVR